MGLFHGIMFLFFFEMFGELVSSSAVLAFIASPTGNSSSSGVPAYIITLFIPPVALLVPFGLGICMEIVRCFCVCLLNFLVVVDCLLNEFF